MIEKNISNLVFLAIGIFLGIFIARNYTYSKDKLADAIVDGILTTDVVNSPETWIHIDQMKYVVKQALEDPNRRSWSIPSERTVTQAHMVMGFTTTTQKIENGSQHAP